VAALVHAYFVRLFAAAPQLQGHQGPTITLPDTQTVEAIIDAAFWASLRREEGYTPRISLAYFPPTQAKHPLLFERLLPLTPGNLSRLAPAVERPGIHLGVWPFNEQLSVWGTTRAIPQLSLVLEVIAPGLLVVKYRRGQEPSKFVNVVVLNGDQIKEVDETGTRSLPDCPDLLSSLLGFVSPTQANESVNVLVQLAVSMRLHGRGGSLLVVPDASATWQESIVRPVTYALDPPFSELANLMRQDTEEKIKQLWQEALIDAVEGVAGLTAVDGATIINQKFEVLAFGAKIGRRDGGTQIERVIVTEPIIGGTRMVVHPVEYGGTRHLSAAQFVYDQRDSVALVASQDGRFTVFGWSPCEEMVHAHRIETLLL
jgi:hypothetical protein